MPLPLSANTSTAGALLSSYTFQIPPFQREYSWGSDQVDELCQDLRDSLDNESYFLGLIVLVETADPTAKQVIDGQQRILTLSLISIALMRQALRHSREALARDFEGTFLKYLDYKSDETRPRISFADKQDNDTYVSILEGRPIRPGEKSEHVASAFKQIERFIDQDLSSDPFKRLGKWAEFLKNRLIFATFVHPDSNSAYQVYEVINTRGKDLTTADLLKNFVLNNVAQQQQSDTYDRWQYIAKSLPENGGNTFVQFIRHVVTVSCGHVLPKDLYAFMTGRKPSSADRPPPSVSQLLESLVAYLPTYIDMDSPPPAMEQEDPAIAVYRALSDLNVIAVRPILLALKEVEDGSTGMEQILRLVFKRMVAGNLGTGNVERRFGETAYRIHNTGEWELALADLRDLEPRRDDFIRQASTRSFSNRMTEFLLSSCEQRTTTPVSLGYRHVISRAFGTTLSDADAKVWSKTIGNSMLLPIPESKSGFSFEQLISTKLEQEFERGVIESVAADEWNAVDIERRGVRCAEILAGIWYSNSS
jgi:hypothetical protein